LGPGQSLSSLGKNYPYLGAYTLFNLLQNIPKYGSAFDSIANTYASKHHAKYIAWNLKNASWDETPHKVKHPVATSFNTIWYFPKAKLRAPGGRDFYFSYVVPATLKTHIRGIVIKDGKVTDAVECSWNSLSKNDKIKVATACMFGAKYNEIYPAFYGFYLSKKQRGTFYEEK
jgi:hypothetical protein